MAKEKKDKKVKISVVFEEKTVKKIDEFRVKKMAKDGRILDRSKAIRELVRDGLKRKLK